MQDKIKTHGMEFKKLMSRIVCKQFQNQVFTKKLDRGRTEDDTKIFTTFIGEFIT